MTPNPMRFMLVAGTLGALAGFASFPAAAATANVPATAAGQTSTPIVVAQASPGTVSGDRVVVPVASYPAYQRGVRMAADEGPQALRRYIWRTRMIYNFFYPDFILD